MKRKFLICLGFVWALVYVTGCACISWECPPKQQTLEQSAPEPQPSVQTPPEPPTPVGQTPHTFDREILKPVLVSGQYWLFLPATYHQESQKRWPTILYLHGSSLRGTNLEKVKTYGLPKLVEEMPDFQFIVISPQCPAKKNWSNDMLTGVLDEVISKYRVDENRIYLTGVSQGGYGTWAMAIAYPDRFAAIAPLSGGGDPKLVDAIAHLPVWVFHGAKDKVVSISQAKTMVNALEKIGANVKFTIYKDGGHDIFAQVYENSELYEWFLEHKRQPPIPPAQE